MQFLSFLTCLGLSNPRPPPPPRRKLEAHREDAIADAVGYLVAHGGAYAAPVAPGEAPSTQYTHAPFALEPFPFPKAEYDKVVALQPAFSRLVDAVAKDAAWLESTLAQTAASDAFTRRLLELRRSCASPQGCSLGLLRSDYMVDAGEGADADAGQGRALQVELNTIASSFGCLSTVVAQTHAFVTAGYAGTVPEAWLPLPPNAARSGLAAGIAAAHAEYARQFPGAAARVAFVVQPGERNQMDQRMLAHELRDVHGIDARRVTLLDLLDRGSVDAAGALTIDGWECSVAYLRAGYSPDEYLSEREWEARAALEASRAIKCPTVAYQLAGCKKVQQALAAPGALERFAPAADAAALRTVFAGLYDLDVADDSAAVDAVVQRAIADPGRYVLKPQREGGGNNLYGAELAEALKTLSPAERAAYILMDRIVPPTKDATLVRDAAALTAPCVCELGVYGTILTDAEGKELLNAVPGHLLRQKYDGVDEGGVAAGFACLSSPALVG